MEHLRVFNRAALTAIPKAGWGGGQQITTLYRDTADDGGGGTFHWDPGSSDAADGGTVFAPDEGGAGRWKRVATDSYNVKWFGAKGDGATDDASAIGSTVTAALAAGKAVLLSSGTYAHATTIDFGFEGLRVICVGKVILKCTGTVTNCVKIDSPSSYAYSVEIIGDFNINGSANTSVGLYVRNFAHNRIKVTVKDVVDHGVKVEGDVLSKYDVNVSWNDGAFTTTPVRGLTIGAGIGRTTACDFYCVLEGIVAGTGLYLDGVDDCNFYGTSEFNATGVILTEDTTHNIFFNFACEGNATGGDVSDSGARNQYINGYYLSRAVGTPYESVPSIYIESTARQTKLENILGYSFYVEAGAEDVRIENSYFTFTDDDGTRSVWRSVYDLTQTSGESLSKHARGAFPTAPAFGGSGGNGSVSYTTQTGTYGRDGDWVTFDIKIDVGTVTTAPTGNLRIINLPYSAKAGSVASFSIGFHSSVTLTGGYTQVTALAIATATYMELYECGTGTAAQNLQGSAISSATIIYVSGRYQASLPA